MRRRQLLASLCSSGLWGCQPSRAPLVGGFATADMQQGHAWRDRLARGGAAWQPSDTRRAQVLIVGAGVAGLAAARALRLSGVDDLALLELQADPGGNSRASSLQGLACPLGAHYLPLPGDSAFEVQDLLEELGLRQRQAGRWRYDERYLCHSPQERLYFNGHWQEGLLPLANVGAASLAQYRRFAQLVREQSQAAAFAMPSLRSWQSNQALAPSHQALDALFFADWLDAQGLHDRHLRWYLDYCCRDDFGAGAAQVSAWAGIHYFASRHGFHAPDEDADADARDAVLTWPQGNGWLTQQLAAPWLASGQLHCNQAVLRIAEGRHAVEVDVLDLPSDRVQRWQVQRCIVALPVYVAARVVQTPPHFLRQAAARLRWAPWLVANIHIDRPLQDQPGAAPAWDNVLYDDPNPGGLGYVNAGHQRLDVGAQLAGATVLTYYQALGDWPQGRQALAQQPWTYWRDAIWRSLAVPHPDLPERATHLEIMRYGHAMSTPLPGGQQILSQISLQGMMDKRYQLLNGERSPIPPTPATQRLLFAHADWSGYSVFEEAFTRGHGAGLLAAARL